ncbi:Methyltransferase-like protein 16 -like protein [Toxocara canis]|uniref:U6 small nuclear RNA (adenine-(43)-N(6))-methyltransferase n=1 Tax=Toxocara canis TaxID=6265 RepID=A0A0B2VTT6_TOXCA|nr:Methyltransferase-like protein 16 -like protein [Toxocara canis]
MLHNDFGLDVELPSDCLVPRVPQRLNYVLFIDDLLTLNGIEQDILGIDIGTGASCIYALLGAKQCGWRFVATESDEFAAQVALKNVCNNGLGDVIKVIKVREDRVIKDIVRSHGNEHFTFCMCNPPFYEEEEAETKFVRLEGNAMENKCYDVTRRAAPRSATIGRRNELSVSGGEVGFVGRLIEDSLMLQNSVKFYTSMVGKKTSLNELTKKLKDCANAHYAVSTLSQGRTQRWVLTWSFDPNFKLSVAPSDSAPLKVPLPSALSWWPNECHSQFKKMLSFLEITYEENEVGDLICEATRNTWSQQRQKRRAERSLMNMETQVEPERKRARYERKDEGVTVSMGVGDGRDSLSNDGNFNACTSLLSKGSLGRWDVAVQAYLPSSVYDQSLVRFRVTICCAEKCVELRWIDGSRHALHQISQYLKNQLASFSRA